MVELSLHNKTIFITGGNDGIGFETARLFATLGANVAILGRRAEKNAEALAALRQLSDHCVAYTCDVLDEVSMRAALADCCQRFSGLDYAFNNAGVEQAPMPLTMQDDALYYRVMDINVKGVWLCMKLQIPLLLARGGGAIVNNSSASGITGTKMLPLYSASKHAVQGLTKSVALEYAAQGIRVNSVCPGAIATETYHQFVGQDADLKATIEGSFPMQRVGTADEVARAVLYLCRDATFATGSALMMDGGRTAQ
jgi:NAD(P)-dependent dehydrogenase (short-subunit alcohol dehydrogenase family)